MKFIPFERERIDTTDNDFLDLDWFKQGAKKLAIISHGLEGNSSKPYVKGMARAFYKKGYDVLAWNFRGCSGEINQQLRFYHSGATDDLDLVINHALKSDYRDVTLVGFSLGGNITLKYLGERGHKVPEQIKNAVAISVPLHLHSSCVKISQPDNLIYSKRFLNNLKKKVRLKAKQLPGKISTKGLNKFKNLIELDDAYTAPIHGFKDAIDYYEKCSSIYFLDAIKRPTLILNAKNDPFLSEECYPEKKLKDHPFVTLEIPHYGGHVGFTHFNKQKLYWSEQRALSFVESVSDT